MRANRTRALSAVVLALGLTVGATATQASAATAKAKAKATTFVGKVPETDAFIAVVVGKHSARAYLCDGAGISEWLSGAVSGGVTALESPGGATLVAEVAAKQLRGTIVLPDDRVLSFNAKRAKGKAGLFREERTLDAVPLQAGWVRLTDGSVRGAVTIITSTDFESDSETVSPAEPGVEQGNQPAPDEGSPTPRNDQESGEAPPPTNVPKLDACDVAPHLEFCAPDSPPAAQFPAEPPGDALVTAPPALDETTAATEGPAGSGTPPGAALPGEPSGAAASPADLDTAGCSRIIRALSTLVDELEVLDAATLEALTFEAVFGRLRDHALAGGCQGVIDAP